MNICTLLTRLGLAILGLLVFSASGNSQDALPFQVSTVPLTFQKPGAAVKAQKIDALFRTLYNENQFLTRDHFMFVF